MKEEKKERGQQLGQFLATAICGNDILSSVLYVAGIAAVFAGVFSPIVLLIVALVLFFYRTVYREVVEALPVNGGAYNALLNGTSKTVAATAGVMTILSYTATAVISAKTGVEYLLQFLEELSRTYHWVIHPQTIESFAIPFVILVILFFAVLVIAGIKDSAAVALAIFSVHILTLISVIAFAAILFFTHGFSTFSANIAATHSIITQNGGIIQTIFFGFSACLLGVSGFESSANFVEEQKKGVFKFTLRNMVIGIMVFNPLIALAILNVLPLHTAIAAQNSILTVAAYKMGGLVYAGIISIDAFLVLSGAVLTAFVGVSGLVNRMTLDECLPSFLIKENKAHAHPRIVIAFFFLCTSILLLTKGDLLSLAGVYTISFLSVMTLFAVGNLILRQTRRDLKRPYKAPLTFVFIAFCATALGIVGNIIEDKTNLIYFLGYFVPAIVIVYAIIYKKDSLKIILNIVKPIKPLYTYVHKKYLGVLDNTVYVFVHHTDKLYRTLEYIANNESGSNIVLLHCSNGDDGQREQIQKIIPMFRLAGAYPDFNIKMEYINKPFNPKTIDAFARRRGIKKNKIFIGSIHDTHEFDYDELGGVRIIS